MIVCSRGMLEKVTTSLPRGRGRWCTHAMDRRGVWTGWSVFYGEEHNRTSQVVYPPNVLLLFLWLGWGVTTDY